jgi:Flp pilus assembly protein TadG
MVEFALIVVPLLVLVGGIIYFGIGLNYWLDMNRVANQGARWAAVNNWPPQCPRPTSAPSSPGTYCNAATTACATVLASGSKATLQNVLRCSTWNEVTTVTVCYPGKTASTATIGDPVQVKLTAPYTFWFFDKLSITLSAKATMRLEQLPTFINGAGGPACA